MNIVLDVVEAIVFHPFTILYAMLCVKHEDGRDPAGGIPPICLVCGMPHQGDCPIQFFAVTLHSKSKQYILYEIYIINI